MSQNIHIQDPHVLKILLEKLEDIKLLIETKKFYGALDNLELLTLSLKLNSPRVIQVNYEQPVEQVPEKTSEDYYGN